MDFNDTPEEAAFRAEVRAWLEANATPKAADGTTARHDTTAALLDAARAWQSKKAQAGFAAITWPKEYGGLGGTPMQQVIYNQEESRFDVPRGVYEIGLGMCIPTLMAYATPAQCERFVAPALHGEEIWCQLFSEPSAGSDVAGLRTRCEKVGDEWVVNGQKVWTSGAHFCDYGILVARSDPSVPKHKGLTFFFLSMKSPGVEVRPIKQASGGSGFNEVFFNDVRIPDSQRLGEIGDGWKVALTTLMHERLAIGGTSGPDVSELIELTKAIMLEDGPAINNAAVREKIADWYVRSQGLAYTRYRTLTALSKGQIPGPESSIGKVVAASQLQDLSSLAMDLEDMGGIMTEAFMPLQAQFQQSFLGSAGLRIAGGTDEILRNIIAERVLGMPGDIRVDKDIPFNELPSGV